MLYCLSRILRLPSHTSHHTLPITHFPSHTSHRTLPIAHFPSHTSHRTLLITHFPSQTWTAFAKTTVEKRSAIGPSQHCQLRTRNPCSHISPAMAIVCEGVRTVILYTTSVVVISLAPIEIPLFRPSAYQSRGRTCVTSHLEWDARTRSGGSSRKRPSQEPLGPE